MSMILDKLTKEQREIVSRSTGPSLVIASAGTGKTTTLVGKIAQLIERERIAPEKILLLTFTNKAAGEMVDRLRRAYEGHNVNVDALWAGTFHAVAARLLRSLRAEQLAPYTANFGIKTPQALRRIFSGLYAEQQLPQKKYSPAEVLDEYWLALNLGYIKEDVLTYFSKRGYSQAVQRKLATLFAAFESAKQAYNCLDFSDLIYLLAEKLADQRLIQSGAIPQLEWIIVDEYQDTNPLQSRMVDRLAQGARGVFAVGDYDQTIFGFQGSSQGVIGGFVERYPGAQVFNLKTNFRSTPEILAVAGAAIAGNPRLFPKEILPYRHTGGLSEPRPRYCHHPDDHAQCANVAENIQRTAQDLSPDHADYVPLSEIAVIYRGNRSGNTMELACKEAAIPYRRQGGISFFDRYEIAETLNLLEALLNPRDALAWAKLISHCRGMGATRAQQWISAQRMRPNFLSAILASGQGTEGLSRLQPTTEEDLINLATLMRHLSGVREPVQFFSSLTADKFFRERVLLDYLRAQVKNNKNFDLESAFEERLDKLSLLSEMAAHKPGLREFYQSVMLDGVGSKQHGPAISLLTIHSAKGLEWQKVFLIDLYEGAFPNTRLMVDNQFGGGEESGVEEERRLFYVALTRAKDYLFLNYPRAQLLGAKRLSTTPSRFIGEILATDENLLKQMVL